jgi:hypothetical protein
LSDEVSKAREHVSQAQGVFANSVAQEFAGRWRAACDRLGELRAEAAALSSALRARIECPAPYLGTTNPVTGRIEVRPIALGKSTESMSLPPALATVGSVLDRLGGALGLIGGLLLAAKLTEQARALARVRGQPQLTLDATYEVIKAFTVLESNFETGALVNRQVLAAGLLHRFLLGRNIQQVEGVTVAA